MTNKSTKRALLASVMALLLCFTMLLGTTFAWFTDSVSNGVNKIVSGNLDIELYHINFAEAANASPMGVGFGIPKDATGEKIEANTKLFLNENGDEMLWEPGATCVESFRIKNEGSLALKYQFKLEVENATATPEGKTLADIINISSDEINYNDAGTPMGTTKLTDRPLGDGYVFEGTLEAGEQYDFWIGLQWVSSDVDNEYNVKGGLKLDLGVTLLATQYTSEFDNFYDGDQYDQGAEYPIVVSTVEELKEALTNGADTVYVSAGTYTFPTSSFSEGDVIVCDENTVFEGVSKLNIDGATVVGATFKNPTGTAVDQTINGTFKNCTFTGANGLRWCYAGETVVFENCVFDGSTYGVHFDGGANYVTFKNCTISGFNAMGGAITKTTFEGCTFVSNGKSNYNGINMWGDTDMINCTFVFDGSCEYEWIDLCGADKTATFTNCVVKDGTNVSNVSTLIGNELTKRETSGKIIVDGTELSY